jgi:hypothetical protein
MLVIRLSKARGGWTQWGLDTNSFTSLASLTDTRYRGLCLPMNEMQGWYAFPSSLNLDSSIHCFARVVFQPAILHKYPYLTPISYTHGAALGVSLSLSSRLRPLKH